MRVVGAGLGRTGTLSLKMALERLLGAPCYDMVEVYAHQEHIPVWHAAAQGEMPDWHQLLAGYQAAVDWPAAAFWPELSEAFPDAVVLLSVREPRSWWESANQTIFPAIRKVVGTEWRAMIDDLFSARFTHATDDANASMAAFEDHNARVRASVPAQRLVEWQPGDGWGPLCSAIGVPVPDEAFPHANTREHWLKRQSSNEA